MKQMGDSGTKMAGRDKRGLVALTLAGVVAGMLGLSFAAVPLYRMFCQATGIGGVPQVAEAAPDTVLDRKIKIRFDTQRGAGPALAIWGRTAIGGCAHRRVRRSSSLKPTNNTGKSVSGTAGFNVAPEIAGRYFTKIECFCFKQQTLAAGQSVEMPVTFFVDPNIVEDDEYEKH